MKYFVSYAWMEPVSNKFGFGNAVMECPSPINGNNGHINRIQAELATSAMEKTGLKQDVIVLNFIPVE